MSTLPTKTNFCGVDIPLWDDLAFFVDGNSKITGGNGTFDEPKPNAFSLPHISHCPGSTPDCRASCYVHGLKKYAPELAAKYELNAMALARVLLSFPTADRSACVLADWITENAPAGFRWHVSGDVTSERHAQWIGRVCTRAEKVPFWIYTRTLEVVPILAQVKNLAVNVSADKTNYARARRVAFEAKRGVEGQTPRICYLTTDGTLPENLEPGSVIFPDYALRGRDLPDPTSAPWWQGLTQEQRVMVCPTDFFGQSEAHRCGPCRKCLDK